MSNNLKFVFFGTPDVASETLEILKENGYIPSLIITSPDKPQGRKMILTPPPVKIWAEKNNLPYLQPEKLNKDLNIDSELFIVVAYGKIIPKEILKIPPSGSINIHYSLLPKYRGASPVESAILNGDTETGVTIQKMEFKLDSGPILAQEKVKILSDEKTNDLRSRLIKIGGNLLVKKLPEIINNKIKPTLQKESEVTHCKKINKEDGLINLNTTGTTNYNKFRAYVIWPRTFFFEKNKRIIITDAVLENGNFIIKKIIPEGKKEITWEEFKKTNISR